MSFLRSSTDLGNFPLPENYWGQQSHFFFSCTSCIRRNACVQGCVFSYSPEFYKKGQSCGLFALLRAHSLLRLVINDWWLNNLEDNPFSSSPFKFQLSRCIEQRALLPYRVWINCLFVVPLLKEGENEDMYRLVQHVTYYHPLVSQCNMQNHPTATRQCMVQKICSMQCPQGVPLFSSQVQH